MVIFIDLDDTLYPPNSGMWQAIMNRIELFMVDKMKFPLEEVPKIRAHLFRQYGTTLRGLQTEYRVNTLDYLQFVHDVPLRRYIQPDPVLEKALKTIPHRKVIFTNADVHHARRVLDVLGLTGCFEEIIDIVSIAPWCKPQREAFELAMDIAGAQDVSDCILVDDAESNIDAASALGFKTVKVGNGSGQSQADVVIPIASHLPEAILKILPREDG